MVAIAHFVIHPGVLRSTVCATCCMGLPSQVRMQRAPDTCFNKLWVRIHRADAPARAILRKCLNAPCGQVEVECAARAPSTSGRQGAGEPYWATPAGQPLRFTVGDSWVSSRLATARTTVCIPTQLAFFMESYTLATGPRLHLVTRARCRPGLDEAVCAVVSLEAHIAHSSADQGGIPSLRCQRWNTCDPS